MIYKKIEKYLATFNIKIEDVRNKFTLQDDGSGAYIKSWDVEVEEPTNTQLNTISDDEILLQEAKTTKLFQLKTNRNTHNLSPMESARSKEVVFDKFGFSEITDNEVYFRFLVTPTAQPASEPSTLISDARLNGNDKYTRYSCTIIEDEKRRKGYVMINADVASTLSRHISERVTQAIKQTNDTEDQINACTTLKEVEAIDINIFQYKPQF